MVATAYAETPVRGRVMRLTKLDNCGNPVSGAGGTFVTAGFVTVKATKNMDSGTEIKVRNANDTISVYQKGVMTLLNFDLEIDWSVPDVGAIAMMTGDPAIMDAGALTAGWIEEALQQLGSYFALEVWTGIANQQCAGTTQEYGYWLYPFIENGVVYVDDVASKEVLMNVKGNTRQGNNWGKGPYDVVSSAASPTVTPAWLANTLPSTAHRLHQITTVAPPTPPAFAGMQTLTPVSS